MINKVNIIFDMSHIYHKTWFVAHKINPTFSLEKENDHAVFVRKFFTDICAAINLFDKEYVKNVYFCFDSKELFRKQVSLKYKATRTPKEQSFYDTLIECMKILQSNGFNCLKIDGFEADDLVALIASLNEDEGTLNVIYSGDEDTHQLIDDRTVVYNNLSKSKIIYYSGNKMGDYFKTQILEKLPLFANFYKIYIDKSFVFRITNPFIVLIEKIFLGCEGDEVERIAQFGIGPKKIEKVVKKLGFENKSVHEINEEILLRICEALEIKYEWPTFQKQLQLVCLQKQFYPEQILEEFYNLVIENVKQLPAVEIKMQEVLKSTKYIHYT